MTYTLTDLLNELGADTELVLDTHMNVKIKAFDVEFDIKDVKFNYSDNKIVIEVNG